MHSPFVQSYNKLENQSIRQKQGVQAMEKTIRVLSLEDLPYMKAMQT